MNSYRGCCFFYDGTPTCSIPLRNYDDILTYIKLQVLIGKDAKVIDSDGNTIIHLLDTDVMEVPKILEEIHKENHHANK